MTVVEETPNSTIFLDHFEGIPVRFRKDKKTGEITIFSDDVAKVFGYSDTSDMLSDDKIMDHVIEIQKETGEFPIQTIANL